ncbi:MAG: hypothetical protein AAFW76_11590, partial [Pseudomonadota bacterium]
MHRQAIADAPDFAARHLPKLLHTLQHEQQIAVLSTIAGRGLEYAKPWTDCTFEKQLQIVRQVSRGLLEDWNKDYTRQTGMRQPREMLRSWLDYRLDPEQGGRLHGFLSDRCGLTPEEPSITFEGHWYPNPLAFALGIRELPDHTRLRMITGHSHGDFHGLNVLVGRPQSPEPDYYLIDLAHYQSEQYLLFDHAYFELAHLLNSRADIGAPDWQSILAQLSRAHDGDGTLGLRTDDIGLIELVRALRKEVTDWIDRHEGDRLSYMESQYLLARVAAGLNFANKNLPGRMSQMAFAYAASNLKDYVELNQIDWPKHGPLFTLGQADRPAEPASVQKVAADPAAAARPPATTPAPGGISLKPENQGATPRTGFGQFFDELRRCHVVKVAGLYLIVAWLAVQAAGALKAALTLPPWTDTLVTVLLALGFPIACIIAWAFELSPSGLQRTQPERPNGKGGPRDRGVLDYVVTAGVIGLLVFMVWRFGHDYVGDDPTATAGSGMPSIAVLPFKNLSQNSSD